MLSKLLLTFPTLLVLLGSAQGVNKEYLGCFVDSPRNFPIKLFADNTVTPSSCAQVCLLALDWYFSGVQWYNECWCSDSPPLSSVQTDESECNTPCNADPNFMCGGGHRMNIYKAEGYVEIAKEYLGCYVDDPRIFGIKHRSDNAVTPISCAQACVTVFNMQYSGVQWYNECWCSSSAPPSSALTNESECNLPCNANPAMTCGVLDEESLLPTYKAF